MSVLESWCNDKGLSPQQKIEIKKHMSKDGGETERDKKLFNFLSKKPAEELAKSNYVYCAANIVSKMSSGIGKKQEK